MLTRVTAARSSTIAVSSSAPTIPDAFARVAARFPDREAVLGPAGRRTYAQLAAQANRVARHLVRRGVRPGDTVPVVARRGVDLPGVLLGVLLAGAAYAVLDTRWPASRTAVLLERMRPPVVLADPVGSGALAAAGVPCTAFADLAAPAPGAALPEISGDAVATLFWTSGSTGEPKAVLSPHRATTRLFTPEPFLDFGPHPVMVNAAAVAWDAFTLELWGMLLLGGTVLVHEDDLLLPHAIRGYVGDQGATHLFLTPALFDVVAAGDLDCLGGLRALLLGGDRPPPRHCRALLDAHPGVALYNGYGPVETCVFATAHRITRADTESATGVPAGTPVPGTEVHVVRDGVPVPPGEVGEVAIGGAALAHGYLAAPDLTAAAFGRVLVGGRAVPVYFTGDRGWLDANGVLHFAGRADAQLKVAGHRVEPAEIEAAARELGSRRSVAVAVAGPRIVLFAEPPAGMDEAQLRDRLRRELPAYMAPARVHFVPELPLLENTKIDKRALFARFGYTS
ncbi:AMP-binding protein [Actinosynnema sp. NPDC059797]